MRIPHQLLRETVSIEDFAGSGARGPVYSPARSVRGLVQQTSRLMNDLHGNQVPIDALLLVRPEDGPVPVESKVTWLTTIYRVGQALPMPDSRRPSHYELSLIRYAVTS